MPQIESDQSSDPLDPLLGSTPGFGINDAVAGDVNGDRHVYALGGATGYDTGHEPTVVRVLPHRPAEE
jgi:hypothetical protein